MFKLIKREIQTVEPIDAERLKKHNIFTSQRPLELGHVKMLADEMKNGTFLSATIGLARHKGNLHLVNGQHTIHAVKMAGTPIEAVIEIYQCDTPDDLSSLFRRYDNNKVRALNDVAKVESDSLGYDWKSRIVSLVVTAASIKEGIRNKRNAKNEKAELLTDYKNEGDFLNTLLDPIGKAKHLAKGATVSAIFKSFAVDKDACHVFWDRVKTGAGIEEDSPERHLRDFLIGAAQRGTRYRVTDREIMCKCAMAWNAFRKGKRVKMLKYGPTSPIPGMI